MSFSYDVARLEPAFDDRPIPYLAFGQRYHLCAAEHVEHTLNASRIYLIVSGSLAKTTPTAIRRIQDSLGSRLVGTRVGMAAHTQWDEVVEVAADAAGHNPDCIVTLGGGSLTDAAKVIAWMLANDVTTSAGLESLYNNSRSSSSSPGGPEALKPPQIRTVAIPTTLSGGEYQPLAGVTRSDGTRRKISFLPPARNPSLVILDPDLTTTTPARVWLSTGVRAVDHCVETLCSLRSTEEGDARARDGLVKLLPSLLRTRRDPADLDARFVSMRGVVDAMAAVGAGVPMGASHAIGHQLGPLGVGHGETSCVMLPAVARWNLAQGAGAARQNKCRDLIVRIPVVAELIRAKASGAGGAPLDLADVLDLVFRELDMPRTLGEVGVQGDQLDALAENTLSDLWAESNPTPLTDKKQVLEILEMVVG